MEDGRCGIKTIQAIYDFQLKIHYIYAPDRIVKPFGPTFQALTDGVSEWSAITRDDILDEVHYLAKTLYGEARGESRVSKVAVGWVIRNRVRDGRWGHSYQAVVTAPLQFTCWSSSRDQSNYEAIQHAAGQSWDDCLSVAHQIVIASEVDNPLPGATHYYSPKSQKALHLLNPDIYPTEPKWIAPPAAQVSNPPGVPEDSYRFYKNVK